MFYSLDNNITHNQSSLFGGTIPLSPVFNTNPALSNRIGYTLCQRGMFAFRDKTARIGGRTFLWVLEENWLPLRGANMIVEMEQPIAGGGAQCLSM